MLPASSAQRQGIPRGDAPSMSRILGRSLAAQTHVLAVSSPPTFTAQCLGEAPGVDPPLSTCSQVLDQNLKKCKDTRGRPAKEKGRFLANFVVATKEHRWECALKSALSLPVESSSRLWHRSRSVRHVFSILFFSLLSLKPRPITSASGFSAIAVEGQPMCLEASRCARNPK